VQIFLQGKLTGMQSFVLAAGSGDAEFAGRCRYTALLSELIPRALLEHLQLARELLGSSGGGQFFVVLPWECLDTAGAFLAACDANLHAFSGGRLSLVWSWTENLGDWSDIRKRLHDSLQRRRLTPLCAGVQPVPAGAPALAPYFDHALEIFEAGFDAATPGLVVLGAGAPRVGWKMEESPEGLALAAHVAPGEDGQRPASIEEIAGRAGGHPAWGVLLGDVDHFSELLRRAQTVDEHIQISLFFQKFFAGELQLACTVSGGWNKLSILHTGGDDFAVFGAWDALLDLAGDLEKLFHRAAHDVLQAVPGAEGKTLAMALVLAPGQGASLAEVYSAALTELNSAKTLGPGSFAVLGRVLEWKQMDEARTLKTGMVRLVREFGCDPRFLGELAAYYRETDHRLPLRLNRTRPLLADRPWRFHRRLGRLLEGPERNRDFQKARADLLGEFVRRNQAHVKLRPAGRVALEWARLQCGAES
jgi:CRISPR-associated protein Csm1